MKLSSRVIEKGLEVGLITLMVCAAESIPGLAQSAPKLDGHSAQVKNAGKHIHLAQHLNPDAKATPLSALINTPYAEHKPAVAPKGNRIYFSRSFYPKNTGGEKDQEDIWYSDLDSVTHIWKKPELAEGSLNNAGANRLNGISVTGDTIILDNRYEGKSKVKPGLSYSVVEKGKWNAPIPIKIDHDQNASKSRDSFVALGIGVIISAVQRKDTYGDRDLYVSFWDGQVATEPVNMGGIINSDMDESSPYLAADTKTLYFASKGHEGFGGFDIFVTKRLDNSWTNWSAPENLGKAVNGFLDEESFMITHSTRYAYFARNVTVHNVDLYTIPMDELFVVNRHFR